MQVKEAVLAALGEASAALLHSLMDTVADAPQRTPTAEVATHPLAFGLRAAVEEEKWRIEAEERKKARHASRRQVVEKAEAAARAAQALSSAHALAPAAPAEAHPSAADPQQHQQQRRASLEADGHYAQYSVQQHHQQFQQHYQQPPQPPQPTAPPPQLPASPQAPQLHQQVQPQLNSSDWVKRVRSEYSHMHRSFHICSHFCTVDD